MSTASLVSVPTARPTISFELYPPRTAATAASAWETVLRLADARPDFFSVTYGASGSSREASRDVVRRILAETPVTPIAHLTCVGGSRAELAARVRTLLDDGVRDFLALRGDPPDGALEWAPRADGLNRASELVALIREVEAEHLAAAGGVSVAVAAYPTGTSHTRAQDVLALREKQDAGADFAITQVFYEPAAYADLADEARAAGVDLPLVAGVIPLTDPGRLARLGTLTGVEVPPSLRALLAVEDPDVRHERGIRATLALVEAVLAAGAPGLHIYTFNQHRPALDVLEHLRRRIPAPPDDAWLPRQHARPLIPQPAPTA